MSNQTKLLSAVPGRNIIGDNGSVLAMEAGGNVIRALSGAVFAKQPVITDANDAIKTGYYTLNDYNVSVANLPSVEAGYGILLVFEDGAGSGPEFVQVILTISSPPHIYIRKKGAQSGWGAWYDIQGTAVT